MINARGACGPGTIDIAGRCTLYMTFLQQNDELVYINIDAGEDQCKK